MIFPDAPGMDWKEIDLQKAVATFLDHLERLGLLTWNHPPNEGKRHISYAKKLKDCGTKAGEPDCVIYLKGGKTVFIELKTITGDISKNQRQRADLLTKMGFSAHFVLAETPRRAVNQVQAILKSEGVRL